MILWKVIKCQAPIPRSFFNHSSSLPAQQMRKRSIMTVATTFQEIQIRRRVVANGAGLGTLQPSDDEIENDGTDGDSPVHHQRLWDAAKTLTRDLKPHLGWLHTTGGVRHSGQLSAAALQFTDRKNNQKKYNFIFSSSISIYCRLFNLSILYFRIDNSQLVCILQMYICRWRKPLRTHGDSHKFSFERGISLQLVTKYQYLQDNIEGFKITFYCTLQ